MRIAICLILILAAAAGNNLHPANNLPKTLDEALKKLDQTIERRDDINRRLYAIIDSAKSKPPVGDPVIHWEEIALSYAHHNVDSALKYLDHASQFANNSSDSTTLKRLTMHKMGIYPLKGAAPATTAYLDSVNPRLLPPNLKALYYTVYRDTYISLAELYPTPSLRELYYNRLVASNDSLLSLLPKGSYEYGYTLAVSYMCHGQRSLAIAIMTDMLDKMSITDHMFTPIAALMAVTNAPEQRNKPEERAYYLALAALSDVLTGHFDGTLMSQLGDAMYQLGDIRHAYSYILSAHEMASESGAISIVLRNADSAPTIINAYRRLERNELHKSYIFIVLLIIALLVIIAFIRNRARDIKRLNLLKVQLSKANASKETNIGQFLMLSSVYMDKFDELTRIVTRKLAAGQAEDLYNSLKNGKLVEEQNKFLYDVFDRAFMHMYPDFVDKVNQLLADGKAITTSEPARLTPELRIFALMRLGLEDSAAIARFLGLSLNTVYTYRNRMKNRAKNRDTFESDIMSIGLID